MAEIHEPDFNDLQDRFQSRDVLRGLVLVAMSGAFALGIAGAGNNRQAEAARTNKALEVIAVRTGNQIAREWVMQNPFPPVWACQNPSNPSELQLETDRSIERYTVSVIATMPGDIDTNKIYPNRVSRLSIESSFYAGPNIGFKKSVLSIMRQNTSAKPLPKWSVETDGGQVKKNSEKRQVANRLAFLKNKIFWTKDRYRSPGRNPYPRTCHWSG